MDRSSAMIEIGFDGDQDANKLAYAFDHLSTASFSPPLKMFDGFGPVRSREGIALASTAKLKRIWQCSQWSHICALPI